MSFVLENIGTIVTILIAAIGAFWSLGKLLARQFEKTIDIKFGSIGEQLSEQKQAQEKEYAAINRQLEEQRAASLQLERRLAESDLLREREFVRRDDFNRVIATFQVGVDHMRQKFDRVIELIAGKP